MDEDIFRAIGENLRRQVVEAMDNVALAAAMQDESGLRSEITRDMNERLHSLCRRADESGTNNSITRNIKSKHNEQGHYRNHTDEGWLP